MLCCYAMSYYREVEVFRGDGGRTPPPTGTQNAHAKK